MSGLRLRKPELPNFQGCQTVFEINVKRKRDFNVFLQIHVSIFCAKPSINILDRLSCLGVVFVLFTYFLCHFYVPCCYMMPFKQIVFPKSKCHEPQLFCISPNFCCFEKSFKHVICSKWTEVSLAYFLSFLYFFSICFLWCSLLTISQFPKWICLRPVLCLSQPCQVVCSEDFFSRASKTKLSRKRESVSKKKPQQTRHGL